MKHDTPKSEFLRIYDAIWEEGPKVQYKNPDKWTAA
jgi:hypothetical protein